MIKNNIDFKYLIFIWIAFVLAVLKTYGHHGDILIDCGREVYYPTQILLGKVLYKDLFNIYGPFSYLFNASLFKLFSINLKILHISGIVGAFSIINLLYFIARRFLPHFLSFSIVVFTISIGVLNLNVFNFIFPYSYAMLYGLVAFLFSLFSLLKYTENNSKLLFFLSCIFAGIAIANKYEFIPYILVLIFAGVKSRNFKWTDYFYSLFCLGLVPLLCLTFLFLQGLNFDNLVQHLLVLNNMMHTQTLKYFYASQGVYFNKQAISLIIINFLKVVLPLSLAVYFLIRNNKLLTLLSAIISVLLVLCLNPSVFIFLPVLLLVLLIVNFKNVDNNQALLILVLSTFSISAKVFWGVATLSYGVFFVSLFLISTLAVINSFHLNKKANTVIAFYFIILALFFAYKNLSTFKAKNCLLETTRGNIYIDQKYCSATKDLISYINKNTNDNDKIVIFPEGTFINFLTQRESDSYYNSLIPLYFETFGEQSWINHFNTSKPDYIVFNNLDMSKDYYFKNICNNYAFSFCSFVSKNYKESKVIDKNFRYIIFKK